MTKRDNKRLALKKYNKKAKYPETGKNFHSSMRIKDYGSSMA